MTTATDLDTVMATLLGDLLRIPGVSGHEAAVTHFVADWAAGQGFETDLWQSTEADVARFGVPFARHLPLAGRPTLVVRLPGTGGGRGVLFNAHADVVDPGDRAAWAFDPWGGVFAGGRAYGRGACDVKGPLVSALWAMTLLQDRPPAGDVLLELVPGEEDCVGLGTLTGVARGWTADASVVLEPTEGEPRCASRGGLRFEIAVRGRAVHGTVKWLGHDAITDAVVVLHALNALETRFNDRAADPLFAAYPFARPVTVDTVHGGRWQGMVCDDCRVGGYFELLPGDDPAEWRTRFGQALDETLDELRGEALGESSGRQIEFSLTFPETYAGHRTPPAHPLCVAAGVTTGGAFNSGCEAGLRANLLGTPTLVWGPGSLAQAHAADEFVAWDDVRRCGGRMADFARRWCDQTGAV